MNDVIQKLEDTKTALIERGWFRGDIVDGEGKVCLLGAACLAEDVALEGNVAYAPQSHGGIADTPLVLALIEEASKAVTYRDGVAMVWRFNDTEARDVNDVLALIDDAILNEKEKTL